jgi:hypothetical protein
MDYARDGYAGFNIKGGYFAVSSARSYAREARAQMCSFYREPDKAKVWRMLRRDGWRIVRVRLVRQP